MSQDPRVDAYIANAPAFAQPILAHVRDIVHVACTDAEETMKWSRPHFLHRGAMLCGMSAFKQHVSLGFWLGDLVVEKKPSSGMGQFGRIETVADLPSKKVLVGFIRKAVALIDAGKMSRTRPASAAPKPPAVVPEDLAAALKKHAGARKTFDAFPPSQRREYIDWITEAKREETRAARLETTIEWLAGGKTRNWKYEKC